MLLPMLEEDKALHVVIEIIGERTHNKVEEYNSCHVTCDLKPCFEPRQPMGPHENQQDQETKRFEKKERIPEYVRLGVNELPLDDTTDCEVDGMPCTDQQIRPPPNPRYVVQPLQHGKYVY
jgi:hypothetical protein